jgi:RNA polymerase sigma-70 factor (ECF subfamily)
MSRRDPLADPAPLIRAVYSFVAYRLGPGPEAEDVTSEVFERALRYRSAYDPQRGEPVAWLIGIARRCLADAPSTTAGDADSSVDVASAADLEADTVRRMTVAAALEDLDERGRELVALRFGADLTARQIGDVLGMKTNAVEVALHRTLGQLRSTLDSAGAGPRPRNELQPE